MKFKPNKKQIEEFKAKIEEMQAFIDDVFKKFKVIIENNKNYSSFYFEFKNKNYRVSTHRLPNRDGLSSQTYRKYTSLSSFETIEIVTSSRDLIKKRILEILNN